MLEGLAVFTLAAGLFSAYAARNNWFASIKIKSTSESDSGHEGLRFYRPTPYLLVSVDSITSDGNGKVVTALKSEIIWLPDYADGYTLNPTGWIGTADLTVSLRDGWNLTDLTFNRDAKAPELTEQVSGAIGSLFASGASAQAVDPSSQVDWPPGIYRFDYDESKHSFTGISKLNMDTEAATVPNRQPEPGN